MNKLLCLTIFFTSPVLFANENSQFYFNSIACSSGVQINSQVAKKSVIPTGLSLNQDLSELTIYQLDDIEDSTIENNYRLRIFAKDTYLAIPEVLTGEMNNFFLRINVTSDMAQIFKNDRTGKLCGLDQVVITFVKSAL